MKTGMKLTVVLSAIAVFAAGVLVGQNKFGKPKSILHIVTVKWQSGTTEAQKAAALKGVEKMAAAIPGMRNVWLKTIKVQPQDYNNVIVMEFADQKAFDAYADAPAHKEWEKVYIPIRGQSTTHDVTND